MNGNPRVVVKRSKFEKLVTNCSFILCVLLPICPNNDRGQLLKEFGPIKLLTADIKTVQQHNLVKSPLWLLLFGVNVNPKLGCRVRFH